MSVDHTKPTYTIWFWLKKECLRLLNLVFLFPPSGNGRRRPGGGIHWRFTGQNKSRRLFLGLRLRVTVQNYRSTPEWIKISMQLIIVNLLSINLHHFEAHTHVRSLPTFFFISPFVSLSLSLPVCRGSVHDWFSKMPTSDHKRFRQQWSANYNRREHLSSNFTEVVNM